MASDLYLDWAFYFEGLEQGKLLIQACSDCGELRFPPMPVCGSCGSERWEQHEPARRGRLFSYIVMRRPAPPEGSSPIVGVVELDNGLLIVTAIVGIEPSEIAFDLEVELEFIQPQGKRKTHAFRPIHTAN